MLESFEQSPLLLGDDSIAFAGAGLQSFAVEDCDLAALRLNPTAILQRFQHLGDASPADAQHEGEEFVREINRVGIHAVLRHEEPATTTLGNGMQSVAGGALHGLGVE